MDQMIKVQNDKDENGNPTGGSAQTLGLEIKWQNGPLGTGDHRADPNGCFIESVIIIVRQRLEFFQHSKFACRENALAITKLEEALHWLDHRTKRRRRQGTEGTNEV